MKKITALLLCVVVALSLCGCAKNGGKEKHDMNIKYFAKHGTMPDMEYELGDSVSKTEEVISKAVVDDHGEANYLSYESGDKTVMTDGTVCCCYVTEKAQDGLTHIVKYGDAFGFKQGSVSTDVRDTLANEGLQAKERKAKSGELFFIPGGAQMTVLEYEFEKSTILFVFQDHALSAAVIRTNS